jgi:hypothetical protein
VKLHEFSDERETDANAGVGAIESIVSLNEEIENGIEHLSRDPDAIIANAEQGVTSFSCE